jgi:hypothetical protein
MTSTTAIYDSLWLLGLLLQCALLRLLFQRGLTRRIPVFTLLMAFYPLRSTVLFVAFGRLAPATYAATANALSIIDLLLQLTVAAEIALHLIRASGRWKRSNILLIALLPALAWAATFAIIRFLPAHSPIPPDRLQIFASLTMILLSAWAVLRPAPALIRRIALGFAFYGLVNLFATAARASAAAHRDAQLFVFWSYAATAAYLAVVVFWIATLKPAPSPASS